jgi:hypothetical protein
MLKFHVEAGKVRLPHSLSTSVSLSGAHYSEFGTVSHQFDNVVTLVMIRLEISAGRRILVRRLSV